MDINTNGALYFYINIPAEENLVTLHSETCFKVAEPLKRKYVGLFPSKAFALDKLKHRYPDLQVCKNCLGDW